MPLVLFWKLKFLLPGAGLREKLARSQQTSYSTLHGTLPDSTHPFPSHPLSDGGVAFPLSFRNGGQGHPYIHRRQGFKRFHKEKSNKDIPTDSSEIQQRRPLNTAIQTTYTTRLNTKFPNPHTNCAFKGIGSLWRVCPCFIQSRASANCLTSQSQATQNYPPVTSRKHTELPCQ